MKKYCLLTGCSKGLGLSITNTLLENNVDVIGVSRSYNDDLARLKDKYNKAFIHYALDLSDPSSPKALSNKINDSNLALGSFVNNAAVAYDDLLSNLNEERLIAMYRLNVINPMIIMKGVLRNFLLHDTQGSIVNISSISVHTGYKGLSMYASTKGALEALSKNVSREWGELGIRSNSLVCGFMETEMSATLTENQKNRIYARTSLKKPTSLKSAAEMVLFLISDKAESVTGQNIFVDSGTI